MRPRLSERARRLVDALNILWAGGRGRGGLAALFIDRDDAEYEADTRDLEAFDARWAARWPTDCPLVGCTTCAPAGPTADELEVNAVAWQLLDTLPEIWYRATPAETREMAAALVQLRRGVEAGRWQP